MNRWEAFENALAEHAKHGDLMAASEATGRYGRFDAKIDIKVGRREFRINIYHMDSNDPWLEPIPMTIDLYEGGRKLASKSFDDTIKASPARVAAFVKTVLSKYRGPVVITRFQNGGLF